MHRRSPSRDRSRSRDRSASGSRGSTPEAEVFIPQGQIALPLAPAMPAHINAFVPQNIHANEEAIAQPNDPSLYKKLPRNFHKKHDSLTERVVIVLNLALDYFYNRIDSKVLDFLLFHNGEDSKDTTMVLPLGDGEIHGIIIAARANYGNQITLDMVNELKDNILAYFRVRYAADYQPCENKIDIINTTDGYKAKYKDESGCAIMGGKRKSRKSKSKKSRKTRRR